MRLILAALAVSFLSVSAQAAGSIVCEPSEIKEWPENASVKVTRAGSQYKLEIARQYYGLTMRDTVLAKMKIVKSGGDEVEVYTGEKVELIVWVGKGPRAGRLHSDDGMQELDCK